MIFCFSPQSTWINLIQEEICQQRSPKDDDVDAVASNFGAGRNSVGDCRLHCGQRKSLSVEPAQSHGSISHPPSIFVHHCTRGMKWFVSTRDFIAKNIFLGLCCSNGALENSHLQRLHGSGCWFAKGLRLFKIFLCLLYNWLTYILVTRNKLKSSLYC